MNTGVNDRGSRYFLFKDYNDKECSLTHSRLEIENVVWLGVEEPRILTSNGILKEPIPDVIDIESRMLLTQEQVKSLLPMLQKFAYTGVL